MIFLHQAALAGAILGSLGKEATVELPDVYNYSLNLHDQVPSGRRPATLEGFITLRYDESGRVAGFIEKSGLNDNLAKWLLSRFPAPAR